MNHCIFTGYLKIALMTLPVRLYSALASNQRPRLHQLHAGCHQRLKQQMVCPLHGPVPAEEIVKGCQLDQDRHVEIGETELQGLKAPNPEWIEILQFIEPAGMPNLCRDKPYYMGPQGRLSGQAFGVLARALADSGKIGVGTMAMRGKAKIIVLESQNKGLVLTALHHPESIKPQPQWDLGEPGAQDREGLLEMALELIAKNTSAFNPHNLANPDQKLLELVQSKLAAHAQSAPDRAHPDWLEGLKASLGRAKKKSARKKNLKRAA